MTEFWEEAFKEKQEMWGLNPAKSTVITKDFFVECLLHNLNCNLFIHKISYIVHNYLQVN